MSFSFTPVDNRRCSFVMNPENLSPRTIAVSAGRPTGDGAPINQPIVLASNFRNAPDYARTDGTESWQALEEAVGALEGGRCVSFSSGQGVASAIIFALRPRVVVMPTVSYLGVRKLLDLMQIREQLTVVQVGITDTANVLAEVERQTVVHGADKVLLWIESPTNPTLDEADVTALCAAAARAGVRTAVDSTFATPMGQRALRDGATVVMHSGTKFIGGHSDLMIGLACTTDDAVHDALIEARTFVGATPGALEAFLALRGLRTLPIRYEASMRNATELATRLRAHPAVEWAKNVGPMLSFILKGGAVAADRACNAVRVVVQATSLGGVESTMERRQKYAGDAHVNPGLIRMSVGIEDVEDLWSDLSAALAS